MIVPFSAGGPTDVIGRLVAERLSNVLGQQVYVENLPGAGGNLGVETAKRAAPDGYTILVVSTGFIINPSMYTTIGYDPLKDFAPISLVGGIAQRDHRAPFRAGEKSQRADRPDQGQSGQIRATPNRRPARRRTSPPSR